VGLPATRTRRWIQSIDCHCEGEPARVLVGGLPSVPGTTAREKREHIMQHFDDIRKLVLQEPRGYPCQNANWVFRREEDSQESPTAPRFGFVIMEQDGIYPMMSGHNTICVATALLESGLIPMVAGAQRLVLEAPAGPIEIEAMCRDGKVAAVTFRNQPSFVKHLGVLVDVPTLGRVPVDIAYGGMWYAVVEASAAGLTLSPMHGKSICRVGEMIKVRHVDLPSRPLSPPLSLPGESDASRRRRFTVNTARRPGAVPRLPPRVRLSGLRHSCVPGIGYRCEGTFKKRCGHV